MFKVISCCTFLTTYHFYFSVYMFLSFCSGCCCMLNSTCRLCHIRKSFGKNNTKTFQANVSKSKLTVCLFSFVKIYGNFYVPTYFACGFSVFTFFYYCSSSCVFVGACFLGGLYFKWFLVIISNNGLYSLFIPKDRFLSDSICI